MLWFALAVMTGLAVLAALWPLAFRRRPGLATARETEFHKAQLAEIDRDVERGVLPRAEAAGARAEAARRLIAANAAAPNPEIALPARRRLAAIFILVAVPVIALGIYAEIGNPDDPDTPLAARKVDPVSPGGIEAAIVKIQNHLTENPNDERGWEVLAPVMMRMGKYDEAAHAYRQIIRLDAQNSAARGSLGEAMVAAAGGVVTADARAELQKALAITPNLAIARFYLALAAEQDGDSAKAKDMYEALLPEANGRAPWMFGLRARLAALKGEPPPPEEQPAAISPDQQKMIEGMVSGLASRLAQNGGSPEEWGRLIRAYSVLHEPEKAKDALASARKALGQNGDIDALARELGL
jgi:cytochrome c-type biogenesis protein CcmH